MKTKKHRILIADGCKETLRAIKSSKEAKNYLLKTASNGKECLTKIQKFQPELIIVDFVLPGTHGIEILKDVREAPLLKKTGVIITSFHSMAQNYHVAIKMGANYYIEKPCSLKKLFAHINSFFKGTLHPDPSPKNKVRKKEKDFTYVPIKHAHACYLKFWGTRGSNPVSGPEYIRFGGNTCCLELRHGEDLVIIDAGTGIRTLGGILKETSDKPYHILFSHTHWDHLLGFPFFRPIYHPNSEIHLWAPVGFDRTTKELFSDMLAYAYFPVALEDIKSKIVFEDLRDSEKVSFGKIDIYTHYSFHPGSTLCFRIHIGGKVIGYVTDNEFLMGYNKSPKNIAKDKDLLSAYKPFIEFFKGCDLMIHEAQYTPEEYKIREGWGHSSVSNASFLMKACGIKDWIITHHDPRHTDEDLLQKSQLHHDVMDDINHKCRIRMAYDGMFIPL
jgi:phosphoribosyl 1,2-cyclic phosphodiesterase/DNA-binding NarL/FixJ family response regulator